MERNAFSVHKTKMTAGATWVSETERRCSEIVARVIATVRTEVTPETWSLHLCSPFWRIYEVGNEGAWIEWEGTRLSLHPKTLYVVPAWCGFRTGAERAVEHHYVHFLAQGIPLWWAREVFKGPLALATSPLVRVARAAWRSAHERPARSLTDIYTNAAVLAQVAYGEALRCVSAEAAERLQNWLDEPRDVRPALERLRSSNDLMAPANNRELAAACGMSADHFVRRFKRSTGLTPTQYRIEERLRVAANLLLTTERKIDDIAESTGFGDRFYLSRVFKARLGLGPAFYRSMHRLERRRGGP